MSTQQNLHIEEIMRSTHPEQGKLDSSNEQRILLPPQNRTISDPAATRRQQPRSNLTALLESQAISGSNASDVVPLPGQLDQNVNYQSFNGNEADSASGPSNPSTPEASRHLGRSLPTNPATRAAHVFPPPDRIPSSFSPIRPPRSSSIGEITMNSERPRNTQNVQSSTSHVRRCISSKELGTLAPPTGSPFAFMLYQREVLQATLQQRLMDARRTSMSNERSLNSSPGMQDSSESSDCSKKGAQRQLKNETRNRRRAEHTRAVTNDLCEIVTDLFIAESKLLKPSSYGFDTSLQRDQLLKNVFDFVSALPRRYALGVDTPSEVLLHMRLIAAARMDHSRAVVHVTSIKGSQEAGLELSRHLVTISCFDAHGLLEYITRILATCGSRVLDADVMLSAENIVLDRFVVQMKGRLRLDKLEELIEVFLAEDQQRSPQAEEEVEVDSHSTEKSNSSKGSSLQRQTLGSLYFHAPKQQPEVSSDQLQQEIDSAVPLTEMLSASLSSSALTNLVPMRRSSVSGAGIRRSNTMPGSLMQPVLTTPETSSASGRSDEQAQKPKSTDERVQEHASDSTERRRRTLVSREATNFLDPSEEQQSQPAPVDYLTVVEEHQNQPAPVDYLTVVAQTFASSESTLKDRIVPLIPFDELMLIETLGMGRVSTIYRAAWQRRRADNEASALTDVEMVALKVATVNQQTGDTLPVDELRREADIAAMLKHPNICDLIGVAADAECFCLAYEYCEGGSVLSLLSDNARYYEYLPLALDIANGMAYLHSRQVIHRDLKPSNVLLTRDHRAKISDFGMSVANCGQELTAETGTYRYMAPEVIRHENYSSNADVYSFGILLWQLITREVPFATMTPIQAAFSVAEGRRPAIPASTPRRLSEIISACWDQDSHMRPSFTYIAMALADYARLAFSPANVGAQTLQIANEMLATVEGNSTINVDFSTPVPQDFEWNRIHSNSDCNSGSYHNVGLEIE